MLKQIRVKSFRILRELTLPLPVGKPIVFIGPNGVGKSSILEVLDFVSSAVNNQLQHAINQERFGITAIRSAGSSEPVEIELTLQIPNKIVSSEVATYGFQLAPFQGFFAVMAEWLQIEGPRFHPSPLKLLERTGEKARILNEERKEFQPIHLGSHGLTITEIRQPQFYPTMALVHDLLASMRVYQNFFTAPSWARDSRVQTLSPRDSAIVAPTPRLDRRGLDLINALYYIQNEHEPEWRMLVDTFRAEFPFISRIDFPPDPGGGRIGLAFRDQSGARYGAQLVSEGMISFLEILAATVVPDRPLAIAFDEPDIHLHPALMKRVAHLLEAAAQKTTVLVATQSDRFLDFFSDPVQSIRTCEPGPTGIAVRELDAKALESWMSRYTLSQLRAQNQLDRTYEDKAVEDQG